ncbi:MAG: MotA/TolQ/ExbB proton channel family protein [Pirellulales bacterium]|nr:MotA/TolQ/ExbB proton channel family protein [Pirellulales bacterium]
MQDRPAFFVAWTGSCIAALCLGAVGFLDSFAHGQTTEAMDRANEVLEQPSPADGTMTDPGALLDVEMPSIWDLLVKGGWMMVPIGLMSILVVAFGVERALALRRSRIFPEELVAQLGLLSAASAKFDPRRVYRLCQEYPSSASTIIRTMLLKMGRPQSEIENTVSEASQREADRLYSNVRTLNLAAAVTPLMGLLGTVWGMILSFYTTANLPVGSNKAEALANGIYVALVTTFAGLTVAIPAAVLAHWFEGRIRGLLMQIDEMMLILLPHTERYEGKLRVSKQQLDAAESPKIPHDDLQTKRRPAAAK